MNAILLRPLLRRPYLSKNREAVDGSTHDYALFKKHLAEAGAWLLELAETCSAEEKRIKMTSDLGYQGIKKDYPQFDHEQGTKRLRKDNPRYEHKHGGLSEALVKRNKVSRIRIPVEWAMVDMKRYRILRGPYAGTVTIHLPPRTTQTYATDTGHTESIDR